MLAVYISLFSLRPILFEAVSIVIAPTNNSTCKLRPTGLCISTPPTVQVSPAVLDQPPKMQFREHPRFAEIGVEVEWGFFASAKDAWLCPGIRFYLGCCSAISSPSLADRPRGLFPRSPGAPLLPPHSPDMPLGNYLFSCTVHECGYVKNQAKPTATCPHALCSCGRVQVYDKEIN